MNLFDILIHFLQIQTLQWSHNCVVFLCSFHQAALAVVKTWRSPLLEEATALSYSGPRSFS